MDLLWHVGPRTEEGFEPVDAPLEVFVGETLHGSVFADPTFRNTAASDPTVVEGDGKHAEVSREACEIDDPYARVVAIHVYHGFCFFPQGESVREVHLQTFQSLLLNLLYLIFVGETRHREECLEIIAVEVGRAIDAGYAALLCQIYAPCAMSGIDALNVGRRQQNAQKMLQVGRGIGEMNDWSTVTMRSSIRTGPGEHAGKHGRLNGQKTLVDLEGRLFNNEDDVPVVEP